MPVHPHPSSLAPRVRRLAKLLGKQFDTEVLRKRQISAQQWRMLEELARRGPSSAGDVARSADLYPSQISALAAALSLHGLVCVRVGRYDRRRQVLSITPEGLNLVREIQRVRAALDQRLLASVSGDDLQAFERALGEMIVQLTAMLRPGEATPCKLRPVEAAGRGDRPTMRDA